jgi:hypothetical protein
MMNNGNENLKILKNSLLVLVFLSLFSCSQRTSDKLIEIQGKKLISQKPPFTMMLPSEFQLVDSSVLESPNENSLTRIYLYVKQRDKTVEEMLIIQIADKTNPQAGPIITPPLNPYNDKKMYLKGRIKKGGIEIDHLIQSMIWNPEAPSLQPIRKKGITLPLDLVLQGQLMFTYLEEHAVFIRYSKDVHHFGMDVSDKNNKWNKDEISGNEKKVCEAFQAVFMGIIDSTAIKSR